MNDLPAVRNVLAIYAHPDDAETAAGGVLARLATSGADVHVVICAQGDKGSFDPDIDPVRLIAERRSEALAAGAILGVTGTTFLDYPDGTLDERDLAFAATLVRLVRETRADVVFAPDPTAVFFGDTYVNHRDHRAVGWAVLDAVAPAAANPHYFPEQIAAGLAAHAIDALYLSGTLEPNAHIDIADVLDQKIDAMFCHRSQLGEVDETFRAFLRERAAEAGRSVGLPAAEAFRRVTLA